MRSHRHRLDRPYRRDGIRGQRSRRGERGASLVEFAVIAPILFLLVFGLIEFGRYAAISSQITAASREAARFGIATGTAPAASVPRFVDCDGIRDAAREKVPMVTLADSDIVIRYDTGPSTAVYLTCTTSAAMSAGDLADDSRIIVRVRTQFTTPVPLIAPYLNGNTIEATDTRGVTDKK